MDPSVNDRACGSSVPIACAQPGDECASSLWGSRRRSPGGRSVGSRGPRRQGGAATSPPCDERYLPTTAAGRAAGRVPGATTATVRRRPTATPAAGDRVVGAPAARRVPAPTAVTDEPGGVRRFGDGRALRAAYDPAADRTVVATTIGLVDADR